MTIKPKVNLIKHVPLKKISKEVRKCEIEIKKLKKLIFIQSCYKGSTLEEAAEDTDISIPTAYRWLNRWNEEGLTSLSPRKGTGRPSRLSDEDKIKLKEIMINTDYLTTEKLNKIILDNFNINYSLKQTRIIAHQLGFTYSKPYPRYDKTPKDAELQLKKNTHGINLKNSIVGFGDQTSGQNLPNCGRILQLTGEKKNRIKRNADKYRTNIMGFQAINGISLIKFIDNSRIVPMIQFMADVRILNMNNEKICKDIENTVYNTNLEVKSIVESIKKDKIDRKDFETKIMNRFSTKNLTEDQLIHAIQLDINKINIDFDDIKEKTEQQILNNLKKSNLENKLTKEKQIIIILDNYRTHKSKIFQEACKILNIKIIFLPPYSPHLNPIEQIWKSIKRVISITYIKNKEHLKEIFEKEFYIQVIKESFYKKWVEEYIINN